MLIQYHFKLGQLNLFAHENMVYILPFSSVDNLWDLSFSFDTDSGTALTTSASARILDEDNTKLGLSWSGNELFSLATIESACLNLKGIIVDYNEIM